MHEGHHPILEDPKGGPLKKDAHPHPHPHGHDHGHEHGHDQSHDQSHGHSREAVAGGQTKVIAAIVVVALMAIFVVWKFF